MYAKAFLNIQEGIKINVIKISSIGYADDTILIADADIGLERVVDRPKTKVITFSRPQNIPMFITSNGKILEKVNKTKYHDRWMSNQVDPNYEIKCKIEQARNAIAQMKGLLSDPHINLRLRIRPLKCYVWLVILYGA